ncbi:MAG: hydroxymethylglutaryl-CoA synthase family protein [Candidatus Abyssobacteria bacterium SURF_17]|uniref:Hydroxymethylglutaryl-CoA synthase family protein n=1 Tax=Candidatus Abyssobacteria bacterium SURF_17 TaxID=2093361 RepID=A0A419F103_9BACT|nr:MAG: hydroxymethylglutaryl-CoA synthase family protein [Candidatus Abyssubacteria bacterium SURF_17]
MIGIVSYGGYIPKLRLQRMSIFASMGWFAPAVMAVAQGERSMCNWDEDSLTMAVAAARDCLAGMDKKKVDALYLCSTTLPFADRQNSGIVSTALNLNENVLTADFTASQKVATTGVATALDALKGGEKKSVLVVAADKRDAKTAYFYEMWFGDGAASLLLGTENVIAEFLGSYSISRDFVDHYRGSMSKYDYNWEERWVRDEGYSKIIPEVVNGLLKKCNLTPKDISKFVFPCFFKREHRGIAKTLGFSPEQVVDNMHEVCGETGAAHCLAMFISALEEANPGDKILVASFGQGSDALLFQVTDNIKKLPARMGIKGSLANRKEVDSHQKFLKFRDLIQTEMGIRAEAPTQTALTTLYRKRDFLLGFIGGECRKCGTRQIPMHDICVNPDCGSVYSQDPVEFADTSAIIKTFTADMLSVSVDPPNIYGMVQFETGGRILADFSDCELSDVNVGKKVKMAFRKRYYDKERGFHGYFWKAIPEAEA